MNRDVNYRPAVPFPPSRGKGREGDGISKAGAREGEGRGRKILPDPRGRGGKGILYSHNPTGREGTGTEKSAKFTSLLVHGQSGQEKNIFRARCTPFMY